jgi:hypothetical protein
LTGRTKTEKESESVKASNKVQKSKWACRKRLEGGILMSVMKTGQATDAQQTK